jgi:gamma-glutamyl-gamma-aminobutyrate hydrolase PuuD
MSAWRVSTRFLTIARFADTAVNRASLEGIVGLMRPVIGITTYAEEASWSGWTEPAAFTPLAYVRAVEQAGGRPLLVPPLDDAIEETLDALDGVIFSGGGDIDPDAYGAEAHPETANVVRERDSAELVLLEAALARDMPVLAVCRGSQVLNVARGGDLVQHLPEIVGHDRHRHVEPVMADHEVTVKEGSKLGGILGDRAPVKSSHHQGFGRLGQGLQEAAWAEDGTIEALEDPSHRFALGVLWHPEEGEDYALFAALVEQAANYRSATRGS